MSGRMRRDVGAAGIPPEEAVATAVVAGEAAGAGRLGLFDALAVPDFRYLWLGSLVSNVGTWVPGCR